MYCTTCGALVPAGRNVCGTCGSWVEPETREPAGMLPPGEGRPAVRLRGTIGVCPRCDYEGQGLPYFTRGPHMAALLGATLFTLPFALGAGGFVYYGLRHDHRICPRCGHGWGRRGERGIAHRARTEPAERSEPPLPGGNPGVQQAWSFILLTLGAVLLTVGAVQFEVVLFVLGVLATAGGIVLHREARIAREERRAAMIAALQMPVLRLAAEKGGRLTVTEVAASLGWPLRRAEKVLHSLDDGWRVASEVTDDGVIVYEFRELLLGHGPG